MHGVEGFNPYFMTWDSKWPQIFLWRKQIEFRSITQWENCCPILENKNKYSSSASHVKFVIIWGCFDYNGVSHLCSSLVKRIHNHTKISPQVIFCQMLNLLPEKIGNIRKTIQLAIRGNDYLPVNRIVKL